MAKTPALIPVNEPLIGEQEKKYVMECLETGWISSEGHFIRGFEEKWAAYCGMKYGVAVSNGTVALEIAVASLNLKLGDEVILPSFTIISCAQAITKARAIIEQVDWPCEVMKNYADSNLGCKRRVSSGLDWVFQTVEKAIILEDDCLPHPTFFRFCEEMLEKYRDDERVMHISGDNFQFGHKRGDASYYFSRYAHGWGWATWRRAWQYYDVDIKEWTTSSDKVKLLRVFSCRAERRFWRAMWDKVASRKIETWDYQWAFACLKQNALGIVPNVNLISNIGFGSDSTHTSGVSMLAYMPTAAMEFPLVHPRVFIRDVDADEHVGKLFFRMPSLIRRVAGRIKRFVFNYDVGTLDA